MGMLILLHNYLVCDMDPVIMVKQALMLFTSVIWQLLSRQIDGVGRYDLTAVNKYVRRSSINCYLYSN